MAKNKRTTDNKAVRFSFVPKFIRSVLSYVKRKRKQTRIQVTINHPRENGH